MFASRRWGPAGDVRDERAVAEYLSRTNAFAESNPFLSECNAKDSGSERFRLSFRAII
jgi:hypothetical protein